MTGEKAPETISAAEFVAALFDNELKDGSKYDADVVSLVRNHLVSPSVHSQAGVRLASDLVKLAKARAQEAVK